MADVVSDVDTYLFGSELSGVVSMTQSTIFPQTPGVQVPITDDSSTVGAAAGNVSHPLGAQGLYQPRPVTVPAKQQNEHS